MNAAVGGYLDAKAAIEMACVDLAARRLGMAVHAYLGGAVVGAAHFNAWIGILPPDEAAQKRASGSDRGFRSAKIKVGGGIEADRDRVKAVREAVGARMQVCASTPTPATTPRPGHSRLGMLLAPYDLQLFEQPVAGGRLDGMARVRQAIGTPDHGRRVDHRSRQPHRSHPGRGGGHRQGQGDEAGWFLTARRIVETATAAGLGVVIGHGFGLGINTVAEIMVAATAQTSSTGLECVGPLKTADDIVNSKLDLSAGSLALPAAPVWA